MIMIRCNKLLVFQSFQQANYSEQGASEKYPKLFTVRPEEQESHISNIF